MYRRVYSNCFRMLAYYIRIADNGQCASVVCLNRLCSSLVTPKFPWTTIWTGVFLTPVLAIKEVIASACVQR